MKWTTKTLKVRVPLAEGDEETVKVQGMIVLIKAGLRERKRMSDSELTILLDRYCQCMVYKKLGVVDVPTAY